MPPHNTLRFPISVNDPSTTDSEMLLSRLSDILDSIEEADLAAISHELGFVVSLPHDTWSRSARRKRKRRAAEAEDGHGSDLCKEPALVCMLTLVGKVELTIRWLYGVQRGLLESFASHVAGRM